MFTLENTENADKYIVIFKGKKIGHVVFDDYYEVWRHNADLFKSEHKTAHLAAEALVNSLDK